MICLFNTVSALPDRQNAKATTVVVTTAIAILLSPLQCSRCVTVTAVVWLRIRQVRLVKMLEVLGGLSAARTDSLIPYYGTGTSVSVNYLYGVENRK